MDAKPLKTHENVKKEESNKERKEKKEKKRKNQGSLSYMVTRM